MKTEKEIDVELLNNLIATRRRWPPSIDATKLTDDLSKLTLNESMDLLVAAVDRVVDLEDRLRLAERARGLLDAVVDGDASDVENVLGGGTWRHADDPPKGSIAGPEDFGGEDFPATPIEDALKKFGEYQASRDRPAERRQYAATCDVIFYDTTRKEIMRYPLSDLPDMPGYPQPSILLWNNIYYRLGMALGGGNIERSTQHFYEVAQADLKSWETVYEVPRGPRPDPLIVREHDDNP